MPRGLLCVLDNSVHFLVVHLATFTWTLDRESFIDHGRRCFLFGCLDSIGAERILPKRFIVAVASSTAAKSGNRK